MTLTLALPSKGRMKEEAEAFFGRIHAPVLTEVRDYEGTLRGLPYVRVLFLPASEIAARLHGGTVDVGLTGRDLIAEYAPPGTLPLHVLATPGFGHGALVTAVPAVWCDVTSMSDLSDVAYEIRVRQRRRLRVATKYPQLTAAFFAEYGVDDCRMVESRGATEAAPADGTADIITDLSSSGATLEANRLRVLRDGVILQTQAELCVNLHSISPDKIDTLMHIAALITAAEAAPGVRLMRGGVGTAEPQVLAEVLTASGAHDLVIGAEGFACTLPADALYPTVRRIRAVGAAGVTVATLDALFPAHDARSENLIRALEKLRG